MFSWFKKKSLGPINDMLSLDTRVFNRIWEKKYTNVEFFSISKNIQEYIIILDRYSDWIKTETMINSPLPITNIRYVSVTTFFSDNRGYYFKEPDEEKVKEFFEAARNFIVEFNVLSKKNIDLGIDGRNYRIAKIVYDNVLTMIDAFMEIESM